jgi:AraC-like DNA-binding protein
LVTAKAMAKNDFKIRYCALDGVQAVVARTRHVFPRHWHEQYGVGLIVEGAHKSFSGRGMVEAINGDMITVNPFEVHDGAPIGDLGRAWRILYLDPAIVVDAAADIREGDRGTPEFSRPALRDPGVARLFAALFAAMTGPSDCATTLRNDELLLALLSRLLEAADADAKAALPPAVKRVRNRIDAQPAEPVTLAELARECGLSRFQVLRGFVRAVGLTPHGYLMQRRADLARRLVLGGTGLAEAAAEAGFADQSHMTRTFVRKYGLSPGALAAAAR